MRAKSLTHDVAVHHTERTVTKKTFGQTSRYGQPVHLREYHMKRSRVELLELLLAKDTHPVKVWDPYP